jgi:hypothetical protein
VEQTVYEGLYETPACLITADVTVQPDVLPFLHKLYVISHKNWPNFKADNTETDRTRSVCRKNRKKVTQKNKGTIEEMKGRKNKGRKEKGTNKRRKGRKELRE